MNRLLKNERGLTLVELLAALSLFAVVIALSSTVIIQLVNSEEKTSDQIILKQDMNVLINELKNNYNAGENPICINENETRFSFSNVKNGITDGKCMEISNIKEPVSFALETDALMGDFTINTTFNNKPDQYVIDITRKIEEDPEDFKPGDMNNNHQCVFEGNTKFTATTLKNKKNEKCKNKYIINGSAAFLEDLTIHNKVLLEITGDLHIYGKATFKGVKGTICVHNNVLPEDILNKQKVIDEADTCEITKDGAIILIRNVSQ